VILDLDPIDLPYDRIVEAAQAIHKVLDKAGAESVCKTSGKRGMHIYVPLGARYDYDQGRQFAEIVARLVWRQLPELTSVARLPAQRQHKVYLDFLQNRRGQTLAAPYSIRPVAGARVSTPLKWSEVKKGLDPSKFTIKTMPKRLDKVGDLWQPALGSGINLQDCLERLLRQAGGVKG
jgi:bifunctional non-homologous end joining protein LigD